MKHLQLIMCVMFAVFFTGCISTNQGFHSNPVASKGMVKHHDIYADIEVDESKKIRGTSSSTYFLMFRIEGDNEYADGVNYGTMGNVTNGGNFAAQLFSWLNPLAIINKLVTGDAMGKVRSAAAYDAMSGSDADFIAHPTYSYTKKNYLIIQKFDATVEGYAGKYKNFRQVDPLDRKLENAVNKKIVDKLQIQK